MQLRTPESDPGAPPGPSIRTPANRAQRDPTRRGLRTVLEDGYGGAVRTVRATGLPTRRGILDFVTNQALVNCVAWTAGLVAACLVAWLFEVRGLRNLWGLMAPGGRTVVSAEEYRWILSLGSICGGLSMMIFVRHFVLRWVAETRSLRRERVRGGPCASDAPSPPPSPAALDFDCAEMDPDP